MTIAPGEHATLVHLKPASGEMKLRLLDRAPFLIACLMLALLVGVYGSLRGGVFSADELNLDTAQL